MKGTFILLLIAFFAGTQGDNPCPQEQESNWEIELLVPHENCHWFYKCTFGRPVPYECPANLYFNDITQQCDWPKNVDCGDRIDPSSTTTSTTTTPTTTTPTTTTPTTTTPTTTTPTTTTPTTSTPTTTTPTTTTPTTTTPTTTTPTTTTPTTTTPTTTTPTTTTPTTTTPTTTTPTTTTPTTTTPTTTTPTTTTPTTTTPTTTTPTTTTTTPTTTTPTTTTPTTTTPTTTTPTTTTPTTTTPTTTTTTTTTTTSAPSTQPEIDFLENGCPVNPHIHWLLPHESDCNLFYYCVWGQLVLRQCPATLHFNRVIQVCDWPWDAGCTLSANKHIRKRRFLSHNVDVSLNL